MANELLTGILFFVYTWGFGYLATRFVKESNNLVERNLMRIGIGLGLVPAFGLLMNILKIPIDWKIFLFLSLIALLIAIFKNFKKIKNIEFKLKIRKSYIYTTIMLVIFLFTFFIYVKGAFVYPYLEDDDSWSHAIGVKYVAVEKTVFFDTDKAYYLHYIDPYPPTYDMFLGILHQTNNSVYWTLKFFNALIISISIFFFYFFVNEFVDDKKKALFATFALAAIPAYLSHFIWAIALTIPLYFVTFYAVERIKYDKKWFIVAGLVMITTLTSSPTHSTYFGLFFIIYVILKMILEKRFLVYHIFAGFIGLVLSFILWWLPSIIRYGLYDMLVNLGLRTKKGIAGVLSVAGTADRVYTLSDFIWAKTVNMINNPIGIGLVLSFLVLIFLIALVLKNKLLSNKENHWLLITLAWLLLTLYAVNAAELPIKLSPFRVWVLLAIPVSIAASEGSYFLTGFFKKFGVNRIFLLILIVIGVLLTSGYQKYKVNTAVWPPGGFWAGGYDEVNGYVKLRQELEPNTKVFTFVNNGPIIGMDMYTCHWCEDVHQYQKNGFNQSAEMNYNWLKSKNYKYIIIDAQTVKTFGVNETNNKVSELANSNKFQPMKLSDSAFLFKLI